MELDREIFRSTNPIKLYRIARAKYANLSGAGAARYPGRWNRLGQEAIYTCTDPSTPQLEFLKHASKDLIPANLVMMQIHLTQTKLASLPDSSFSGFIALTNLADAMQAFPDIWTSKYAGIHAFAVPSVIAPAWNVVLYPAGTLFWHKISLHSVTPFEFDPELFRKDTPKEVGT